MTAVNFSGAKAAIFVNESLIVIQRDYKPGLPFAGQWDFPGGGREGNETPLECVQREIFEELGLKLAPSAFIWQEKFPSLHVCGTITFFFVAKIEPSLIRTIKFGDEGIGWKTMQVDELLESSEFIIHLKHRLKVYLNETYQLST